MWYSFIMWVNKGRVNNILIPWVHYAGWEVVGLITDNWSHIKLWLASQQFMSMLNSDNAIKSSLSLLSGHMDSSTLVCNTEQGIAQLNDLNFNLFEYISDTLSFVCLQNYISTVFWNLYYWFAKTDGQYQSISSFISFLICLDIFRFYVIFP